MRLKHGLRVHAGSLRESRIERKWRSTSLAARLVGEHEKLLLSLNFRIVKRNIGCGRGSWLQCCGLNILGWGLGIRR